MSVAKVISGGQTGADQGALRAAKAAGVPTGGYAPKGWLSYRVLTCSYGRDACRELLDSGLVRVSGRGRNRKYHDRTKSP